MKRRGLLRGIALTIGLVLLAAVPLWRSVCYDDTGERLDLPEVAVTESEGIMLFDGPGTRDALILYPGAFVEHTAYSALLQQLAAEGVDGYLVRMPLRIALLDTNAADRILPGCGYERVYIGGHSLGGVAACRYAAGHADSLAGIVLLASFPADELSGTGLRVLSVTGSEDGVIDTGKQAESRSLLPEDAQYVILPGGNHAQFGTYGAQRGDGKATISPERQREETCALLLRFCGPITAV